MAHVTIAHRLARGDLSTSARRQRYEQNHLSSKSQTCAIIIVNKA